MIFNKLSQNRHFFIYISFREKWSPIIHKKFKYKFKKTNIMVNLLVQINAIQKYYTMNVIYIGYVSKFK
jgi:hypothetical protein